MWEASFHTIESSVLREGCLQRQVRGWGKQSRGQGDVQWVPAAKPSNLSSILKTHVVLGKKQVPQVVLWHQPEYPKHMGLPQHTQVHKINNTEQNWTDGSKTLPLLGRVRETWGEPQWRINSRLFWVISVNGLRQEELRPVEAVQFGKRDCDLFNPDVFAKTKSSFCLVVWPWSVTLCWFFKPGLLEPSGRV